jgi:hypothetical protein
MAISLLLFLGSVTGGANIDKLTTARGAMRLCVAHSH